MKLICLKRGIRRDWRNHRAMRGILLERDIRIGSSRLAAKLLVFDTRKNFRESWAGACGGDRLGPRALAAVHELSVHVIQFGKDGSERQRIEADPRYYCFIGMVRGYLSMENICHEAVHAGWCFARRKARQPWDAHVKDNAEEAVCYPAGKIAAAINRVLHATNLYEPGQA